MLVLGGALAAAASAHGPVAGAAADHRAHLKGMTSSVTVVRADGRTNLETHGKLLLKPETSAAACSGRVTVTVKRGRRTLSSRQVLLGSDCAFSSSVVFGKSVRKRDRLSVVARFAGNATLAPLQTSRARVTVL